MDLIEFILPFLDDLHHFQVVIMGNGFNLLNAHFSFIQFIQPQGKVDINFALRLDELYKGKMSIQEIEAIPHDDYLKMMEIIKERQDEFNQIHRINTIFTL